MLIFYGPIKERFDIHIHSFSPPEIIHFSTLNDLSVKEVLSSLKDAGLDTIPSGGARYLPIDAGAY